MKTFERVCLVGILLASLSCFALTKTVDGITWTYTVANGEASVGGGSSSSTAVPTSTSGIITIPSTLGGYSVTSIGNYAFSSCRGLTNVTILASVTSIGMWAFSDCRGLTSMTIPDGVTSIGARAFYGCNGLASVTIPDGVTSIGSSVFSSCSGLTNIVVGAGNMNYSSSNGLLLSKDGTMLIEGVNGTVMIPASVTSIGSSAFYSRSGLTSVTIPDSVTNIGDGAFSDCRDLASVAIPGSVTSIGNFAFELCDGLTSMTIPNSVTSIGNLAFQHCDGLTSMTIPNSVTSIGYYAFCDCSGLTNVTILGSVTSIGDGAFSSCSGLTSVAILGSVTSIGDGAFSSCSGLTSVAIPDSVTSIGSSAFYNCSGLKSVTIPDGVTNVSYHAFCDCNKLTSVLFDGNAPIIGRYVFSGVASGCCAYVRRTSSGWGVSIPGEWNGIGIDYLEKIVVFDANGGEGGTNSLLDIGTAIVAPTVTRTGYTFKEWSPSVAATVPATDVTYTAQWEINKYLVTFDANGGVGGTCGKEYYGTAIAMPTVTRKGYTFKGWMPSVAETVPANDVTYTAQWEINQYMVTFDASGGAGGISGRQDYGATIVAPTVTRTGYTFKGWSPSVAATVPANDVTYTAQWEINKYTLTFDANGGTYSTATTTVDYGTTVGELPVPMRTNALFLGWFTAAEEGSLIDSSTAITEAMTLCAHWFLLEEALDGGEEVVVATSGSVPWCPILDSDAKVGDATARSCEIGDRTNTWLSATVEGAGSMAFWYKVSCEHDDDNTFTWDRLMVYTNGVEIMEWRMDGETDWTQRTLSFEGGTNTVKWVYFKDRSVSEGEDCAWVDGLVWTPSGPMDTVVSIGGKEVTVAKTWLETHENIVRESGGDVAAALQSTAANGRLSNVECYVLGLDPEDATNDFKIVSFPMKADGTPDIDNIVFDPPQAKWNVPATYKVMGAADLGGPWEDVPDGGGRGATALPLRFFKVIVELP